jgi:hypothetical protein
MYIAVGTPRVIRARTASEFGGGFELKNDAENANQEISKKSIVAMQRAPKSGFFVTITSNTLSLWSMKVSAPIYIARNYCFVSCKESREYCRGW